MVGVKQAYKSPCRRFSEFRPTGMEEQVRRPVFTYTKLSPKAFAPVPWPGNNRFSNLLRFSGYDVASWEDVLVQPNKMVDLTTRLLLTLPEGSRLITAPRFGEQRPDGVDIVPREIESYELCDVSISFWNRSPNLFQGTPTFF